MTNADNQTPSTQTATTAPATTVDYDAALAAFRAEYVKDGSHVLDAWLEGPDDDRWIRYHVDPEQFADNLGKVPHEYMGVSTILTLFARD